MEEYIRLNITYVCFAILKCAYRGVNIHAMSIWLLLEKISIIFALIALGFIYGKVTKSTSEHTDMIAKLLLNVLVPGSILSSITSTSYETIKADLPVLLMISTVITVATLLLSFLLRPILRLKTAGQNAVYQSALFFNNYGFLGWPICQVLFGAQGLLYAALYAMPINLLVYSITPVIMNRAGTSAKFFDKSVLVNLPVYATVIGLGLLISGVKLPPFVADLSGMVGATQTPLSMIVVGMILATANLKEIVKGVRPYLYSVLRLLILPVAAFLVLRAAGLSGLMLSVPVIITAMPTGTMVVVLAKKHHTDALLASRLIIISTLLSVITIPLISMLVI